MRRIALAIVAAAAAFVPGPMRARWLEEWRAEIDHAAASFVGGGRHRRLLRMALGAVPDVVAVRRAPKAARPRRVTAGSALFGWTQDIRYAVRSLAAARGFSLAVIGSLTLGIAVNGAAFAMLNGLFYRTLPGVDRQDRLVRILLCRPSRHTGCAWASSTYADYESMRHALPSIVDLSARVQLSAAGRIRDEALMLRAALVSPNYFDVLGARLAMGTAFRAEDPGGAVAVISHGLWRRRFSGDPAVLGQFIDVGTTSVRVVGVAPEKFLATSEGEGREIWLPFSMGEAVMGRQANTSAPARPGEYELVEFAGRLAPGATPAQVRTEASVFATRIVPPDEQSGRRASAEVNRFGFRDADQALEAAAAIMPLPLLVLAIACLNATSLVLARGTYRMRDTTVRLALGASRWRIIRQVLSESLLLAIAAGAASIPLTLWSIKLVQPYLPMLVSMDWRVLGFTMFIAAGSALLFGLLPALRAASLRGGARLGSSRAGDTGARLPRMRKVLVVVQVALSLAVLGTGGQSLTAVRAVMSELGVADPDRLVIASFDLDRLKYSSDQGNAFYRRVVERVAAMPGVEAAGLSRPGALWTFGRGGSGGVAMWLPEDAPDKPRRTYLGGYAGGDLFRAAGLALLQGRPFTPEDARAPAQVAIVNRPLADELFGGHAIGRAIRVAARSRHNESFEVRIIGVVEAATDRAYTPRPLATVYLPTPFRYEPALTLYVRARDSAESLVPALHAAVRDVDPRVPFMDIGTLQSRSESRNMEEHILASGATILGAVALILATAGLYGLFSFIVSLRQREIGVRMALGAEPAAVQGLVLGQAMRLAGWGAGAGGAIALVAGAIVNANIYGTPSIDPLMFLASAAVLSGAMLLAGLVPARRASRVDPIVVLRQE